MTHLDQQLSESAIEKIIKDQKNYFATGETLPTKKRIALLKTLKEAIKKYEQELLDGLYQDLRKSKEEGFITEVGLVVKEINYHIRSLKSWTRTASKKTPLFLLPAKSYLRYEPLGNILIVAPWNYPFYLLMTPLIGAISAGNTVVLKPSEYAINTNRVMDKIIREVFESSLVEMIHGGKEVNQILFKQPYDMIFFTGSSKLGQIVMQEAAKTLTPVVLELGGKSPCIVDSSANIDITAKRVAWGKLVNLGQTCIAPDYLLVHESVKDELVAKIKNNWLDTYGEEPQQSHFLPRMINEQAFDRVISYLDQGRILFGGQFDRQDKFIAPCLIDEVDLESPLMQEEIFGPVLPIITFKSIDEAFELIKSKPKPLSSYYFGNSKQMESFLNAHSSGGVTVNDFLLHISNNNLPFGGVGRSGQGRYHGKYSFETFSNARAVMKAPTWIDLPFRYPPFKRFNWIKKLIR